MSFGAVAASYFTLTGEPASYTVFGAYPPPYTTGAYDDATPNIEAGNLFYLTDTNGPVIGYRCKGARVWIPNSPLVTGKPIRLRAYIGIDSGVPTLGSAPAAIKDTVTPVSGGWCEVLWDSPFVADYGPDNFFLLITYAFTDPADQMKYVAATGVPSSSVPSVDIGTTLALADENGGFPRGPRGKFRIGTNESSSTTWYGVDVIVEEPPVPATTPPVAAYNFNEGSGTIIGDATGHGYNLTTQTQYFTGSGHAGAGLQQLAANNMAVNGSFTGLDTAVQQEFTIMFWGKYDSAGTSGDNWTIRQTIESDTNIGWGIMLSDGTDTVFRLRIQGVNVTLTAPRRPMSEWHHYAVTGNAYYSRVYVDGVMVGESYSVGVVSGSNDHNLRIFGGSMQGQTIDDLRFFADALSPAAVQYYMNRPV